MEEFAEIVKNYPGIILTSEKPMTWKGLLIVDTTLGVTINMKLVVPNYPELTDATLLFGKSIALLFGTGFEEKITRLLETTTTVTSLLFQLKRLVNGILKEKFVNLDRHEVNLHEGILDELRAALREHSDVTVSTSNGLSTVKLTINQVSVTLRKDHGTNTWKVINSDLPECAGLEPFKSNVESLVEAMSKLKIQVGMLEDAWSCLMEIDTCCWVIDPANPKPYHLYRRIKLTPSLSALITIDPVHVMYLPDIKLLGSDREVAKYRNILNSNLLKWDPDSSIVDNLGILLAIDELPQIPVEKQLSQGTTTAIFQDDACCICFSMELDDQIPPRMPIEICNNQKCRKHFHTSCLLQWLQTVAGNQISFERIHGTCPNCNENISCPVKTS